MEPDWPEPIRIAVGYRTCLPRQIRLRSCLCLLSLHIWLVCYFGSVIASGYIPLWGNVLSCAEHKQILHTQGDSCTAPFRIVRRQVFVNSLAMHRPIKAQSANVAQSTTSFGVLIVTFGILLTAKQSAIVGVKHHLSSPMTRWCEYVSLCLFVACSQAPSTDRHRHETGRVERHVARNIPARITTSWHLSVLQSRPIHFD